MHRHCQHEQHRRRAILYRGRRRTRSQQLAGQLPSRLSPRNQYNGGHCKKPAPRACHRRGERETPCRAAPSRAMARRWQSDTRDGITAGTTGLLRQPEELAVVMHRRTLPAQASRRDLPRRGLPTRNLPNRDRLSCRCRKSNRQPRSVRWTRSPPETRSRPAPAPPRHRAKAGCGSMGAMPSPRH